MAIGTIIWGSGDGKWYKFHCKSCLKWYIQIADSDMSYMETTMFCHGFMSVVSWLLRLFHSKSLWTSANSHIMHHILNIKEDERNLTTQRGIKCSMVSGVYRKIFLWIGLWYLKIHDLWQLAWAPWGEVHEGETCSNRENFHWAGLSVKLQEQRKISKDALS